MPYIDSFNVGNVVYDIRDKYAGLYTADEYSTSAIYAVGDMVTHDGKLYECNTPIPAAEAWTPAHWTETTVATKLTPLTSEVEAIFEQKTIANVPIASFNDGADNVPVKKLIADIVPIQSGSGDPTPNNVRPITGWTGANVMRVGKNLFDESTILHGYYTDVNNLVQNEAYRTVKLNLPAGTYTFSTTLGNCVVLRYTVDGVNIESGRATQSITITSTKYGIVAFCFRKSTSETITESFNTQIEIGTSVTNYEEYQGSTYPITFPLEAGTVYGGTLDVLNGVLTVDRVMVTLDDTVSSVATSSAGINYAIIKSYSNATGNSQIGKALCDRYKYLEAANTDLVFRFVGTTLYIYDNRFTDIATAKSLVTGTQIVYELATPITYTLTYVDVKTLLAINNIWADTGNINELTYRVMNNTDSKITLTKAIIAPVLNSMIADTALVANDFRIVDNTLYRITTSIASGATLIPNTNCTATTIADVLKSLLS